MDIGAITLAYGLENIWDQGSCTVLYIAFDFFSSFLIPSPHAPFPFSPLFFQLWTLCLKEVASINTKFIIIQEKLKGSLPLAAIDTVERLPEDNCSFRITGPFKHPLILQACSKEECQEWIKAIENGKTTHKF